MSARWFLLVMLGAGLGLGGCPQKGATTTSGNAAAGTTTASSTQADKGERTLPYELAADGRYINTDGRMQAVDAAGNPMFDAAGEPLWEPPPEEQAQQLYEEGLALQQSIQGAAPNEAAAIQRFARAVELVPTFEEAWYNLGRLQLKLNDLSSAQQSLKKAMELDPENLDAYLALGLAQERSGDTGAAQRTYTLGLQKEPENVDLLNGIARILRKQGKIEQAEAKAKEILRINSNSLDAYNTLGLCYLDKGELELARFVFLKAEGSVPGGADSASIQANMGLVLFKMDKEFAAEERFNAARALDPDHVGAMVNLAYLKLKNYDFEGALALLEEAHRILPANDAIKLDLGVAARGTGDVERARRLYEEVITSGGDASTQALLNLGIIQADFDKDYEGALATYGRYQDSRVGAGETVAEDDPIHEYVAEAERALLREQKKKEREARRKARQEAQKAAEQNSGTTTTDGGQ